MWVPEESTSCLSPLARSSEGCFGVVQICQSTLGIIHVMSLSFKAVQSREAVSQDDMDQWSLMP
jgi:hypothetical protein